MGRDATTLHSYAFFYQWIWPFALYSVESGPALARNRYAVGLTHFDFSSYSILFFTSFLLFLNEFHEKKPHAMRMSAMINMGFFCVEDFERKKIIWEEREGKNIKRNKSACWFLEIEWSTNKWAWKAETESARESVWERQTYFGTFGIFKEHLFFFQGVRSSVCIYNWFHRRGHINEHIRAASVWHYVFVT